MSDPDGDDVATPTARQTVFAAIDLHDDGDGAPLGDVVADATQSHGNAAHVCKCVARMLLRGEIYEPRTGYLRVTNQ